MTEVMDPMEANRRLAYLTRLENIITSMALTLSAAVLETMDWQFQQVLQQVAEFEQASRAFLFVLDKESRSIQRLYQWSAEPFDAAYLQYEYLADLLPWMAAGQPVMIPGQHFPEDMRNMLGLPVDHLVIAAPLTGMTGFLYLDCAEYQSPGDFDARLPGRAAALMSVTLERLDKRRLIVEQLERNERLLRVVIDHLPSLIYVKDAESRFILANAHVVKYMNAGSEANLIGKTDAEFYPADKAGKYRTDEIALVQTGEAQLNYEEEVLHQDTGELNWYLTSKIPLRDSRGRVIGLVGINQNITERKQAEMQLQQRRDDLEAAYAQRSEELRRAHELLQVEMAARQEQEAETARLQQQIIDAQKQAILELSSPVIPVLEQVLVMPLVGSIDTGRASSIMRGLLAGITQHKAKVVILDITGVNIVDSGVAGHLNRTMQAARLKGVRTIVTGVSDAVAETIVDLGIDWNNIDTLRDLQSGLQLALRYMGYTLKRPV